MLTALYNNEGKRFTVGHGTRFAWHKHNLVVDVMDNGCNAVYLDQVQGKHCEIFPVNNGAVLYGIIHFIAAAAGCSCYIVDETDDVVHYELFGKGSKIQRPRAKQRRK